jgi:hypothetical protein
MAGGKERKQRIGGERD